MSKSAMEPKSSVKVYFPFLPLCQSSISYRHVLRAQRAYISVLCPKQCMASTAQSSQTDLGHTFHGAGPIHPVTFAKTASQMGKGGQSLPLTVVVLSPLLPFVGGMYSITFLRGSTSSFTVRQSKMVKHALTRHPLLQRPLTFFAGLAFHEALFFPPPFRNRYGSLFKSYGRPLDSSQFTDQESRKR